jgi:hypothetical protein
VGKPLAEDGRARTNPSTDAAAVIWRNAFMLAVLVSTLGACTHVHVALPQLDSARGAFFGDRDGIALEAFSWEGIWADRRIDLLPVLHEGKTVFSDPPGEVIVVFDGWNVNRVTGLLGREAVLLSLGAGDRLTITQGGYAIFAGSCTPWAKGSEGWEQSCEGLGNNHIELGEGGNVRSLSFMIHPAYPPLLLRNKLKD